MENKMLQFERSLRNVWSGLDMFPKYWADKESSNKTKQNNKKKKERKQMTTTTNSYNTALKLNDFRLHIIPVETC